MLISENPIQTDSGSNFAMAGAVGYLYAEQELNEICKIYGYGTGANTSKIFTYKTGDVENKVINGNGEEEEELTEGAITGSGARSVTVEDINNITKYNPATFTYEDRGTTYKYGELDTHTIKYPTKTTESGESDDSTERTDRFTVYFYEGSEYLTDTGSAVYKMLFGSDDIGYWIAYRGLSWDANYVEFGLFQVYMGSVGWTGRVCRSNQYELNRKR